MNARQRKHYDSLLRRRDRLVQRLGENYIGNPEATRRELAAVRFALRVIEGCDRAAILDEVLA